MNFKVTKKRRSEEDSDTKQLYVQSKTNEKEIARLEKLVFGDPSHLFENDDEVPKKKKRKSNKPKRVLEKESTFDEYYDEEKPSTLKPAWEDDDDINTCIEAAHRWQGRPNIQHPLKPSDTYNKLLQKRFENLMGNSKWADLRKSRDSDSDPEDEDDNQLLKRCGNFTEKGKLLSSGTIKFQTLKDLNAETKCEGSVIRSVEFHPKSSVALVAGYSGIVSLYEIGEKLNPKLQTIQFSKFNILCARFSPDGEEFVVGSTRRNFYSYNMMTGCSKLIPIHHNTGVTNMQNFEFSPDGQFIATCGRFGNIFLISAKTKEWLGSLRMNGEVRSISFNSDGSQLYSHGDDGKVYIWDMKSRQCIHTFIDDGCLKGTSICVSPDSRLLACGSSSGVVNIYNASALKVAECPKPLKVLLNLKTDVTSLKFNHTSEILAMGSIRLDSSVRLMHYPSFTVYKNFPENNASKGLINSMNFSPHSGYMAMGNNCSKALLYRLNHFGSY